ncbi:uncharacterized protein LOC131183158 [Hevea brasiliensis]|uniref:uncharacterized protein LOC131183158 n=1 Tax=Hevea brasiliensis TaxID=3981 RepID=UPI0025F38E00|nr:uncharacterized protein LOC131183158 [Hevea brasiliensis]
MPFKRYVEIRRVALVNYGKDYGKLNVFIDVIDQNRAMIGTPNMVRSQMNFKRYYKMVFAEGKENFKIASSSQSVEEVSKQKQNVQQRSRSIHDSESLQTDEVEAETHPLPPFDPSKIEIRTIDLDDLLNSWKSLPNHAQAQFEEKYRKIASLTPVNSCTEGHFIYLES